MAPKLLAEALKSIPKSHDPNLLVGFDMADDAGVYKISDELAMVQTVDFFPPIVDDPYSFGQIAAANALSDIFAMGATPMTALNIVAFPITMPAQVLTDILQGGNDKIVEAGAVVVGGHSIKDNELKYGAAITGTVHPDKIVTNGKAKAGDKLYLTKNLGTGIITTAIKRDKVSQEIIDKVISQMCELNKKAAELMILHKVSSATDVTGFGLMGHGFEMASASNVTLKFFADEIPLISGALELAEENIIPGGTNDNREFMQNKYVISDSVDKKLEPLLFDPQTSGGLLIAMPESESKDFEVKLKEAGLFHKQIGVVEERSDRFIIID